MLKEVLNGKGLDSIIKDYQYKCGEWKYAVVKDKSLWRYAEMGKFVNESAYKSKNRNEKNIPLKKYSCFLYLQEQYKIGFPSLIEFQGQEKWKITYNEPNQEVFTIGLPKDSYFYWRKHWKN